MTQPHPPERINAATRTFVFNPKIVAPTDIVPGQTLQGTVLFDSTAKNIHIQSVTLKLECLEYHVAPPNVDVSATTVQSQSHHIAFLDFFRKHGRAPVTQDEEPHNLPFEVKFQSQLSLLNAKEVGSELIQGQHEYSFEVQVPLEFPLTKAEEHGTTDVILVVSRLHATVQVEGVREECYKILHVLAQ